MQVVQFFFITFIVYDYLGLLLINTRNTISYIIMIFYFNSTHGHTGSLLVFNTRVVGGE